VSSVISDTRKIKITNALNQACDEKMSSIFIVV
jgi:hypothetical protein